MVVKFYFPGASLPSFVSVDFVSFDEDASEAYFYSDYGDFASSCSPLQYIDCFPNRVHSYFDFGSLSFHEIEDDLL